MTPHKHGPTHARTQTHMHTQTQKRRTVGFYLQGKGHNLTSDLWHHPVPSHSFSLAHWNSLLWIQLESWRGGEKLQQQDSSHEVSSMDKKTLI